MFYLQQILIVFLVVTLLSACGGDNSDDGGNDNNSVKTAFIVDSGIEGLEYSSISHQGITDKLGQFRYEPGETTTFSFKGLQIGSITTPSNSSVFTPLDIFATNDVNNQAVKNTLVFLQTLDNDQNPANGISLPSHIASTEIGGLASLDISSSNFQNQLIPALSPLGSIALVSEQDAIEHFEKTLLALNATTVLNGRWLMRDAENGDVSAVYLFSSNSELVITEFEGCDKEGYWVATERSAQRNCSEVELTLSWELAGKELTMFNNDISDNCTIIMSSVNLVEANCLFQGSGKGNELIRFERDITNLESALISTNYREFQPGSLSGSTAFTFNSDLTGSYTYYDDGIPQSNPGDQGNFDWVTDTKLSYAGTDNSNANFSGSFDLVDQIRGALITTSTSEDGSNLAILIPDFDANITKNIINQSVYGIYDAINGDCKQIYIFNNNHTIMPLRKEPSIGSTDICEFSSPIVQPQPGDTNIYSVSVVNGAFVIEQGNEQEICWPIANSILSGNDYAVVACSSVATSFTLEIWRDL